MEGVVQCDGSWSVWCLGLGTGVNGCGDWLRQSIIVCGHDIARSASSAKLKESLLGWRRRWSGWMVLE